MEGDGDGEIDGLIDWDIEALGLTDGDMLADGDMDGDMDADALLPAHTVAKVPSLHSPYTQYQSSVVP